MCRGTTCKFKYFLITKYFHYKKLHKKIKPRVLTLGALALQCPDPFQHCVQLLQLFSSDQLKMKHYCFSFCSPMLYLLCYLQSTSCRMARINSELLCCHNECWIHTPSRLQMSRRRTQVSLGSFLYYFSFEKRTFYFFLNLSVFSFQSLFLPT